MDDMEYIYTQPSPPDTTSMYYEVQPCEPQENADELLSEMDAMEYLYTQASPPELTPMTDVAQQTPPSEAPRDAAELNVLLSKYIYFFY